MHGEVHASDSQLYRQKLLPEQSTKRPLPLRIKSPWPLQSSQTHATTAPADAKKHVTACANVEPRHTFHLAMCIGSITATNSLASRVPSPTPRIFGVPYAIQVIFTTIPAFRLLAEYNQIHYNLDQV